MRQVLLLLALPLFPQSPADSLTSPQVHPDRSITFLLHAPKAQSVTLNGDWMPLNSSLPLSKSPSGTWSITIPPLPPQVYLYSFNLDGLNIPDPINPRIKLRARTSASLVEVPGAAPWLYQDVPHGKVEMLTHKATALAGAPRQLFVYTPPGYNAASPTRYPVLYLFHGSNDVAAGWTWTGHAHLILDNLIAARKARPMIIVMPWGHAVPFGSPREIQATNTEKFQQYLLTDVIPLVESSYRTAPGPRNRAIAGLSMGGGQALHIGLSHLDSFSSIAVFSSGQPRDFQSTFQSQLANPALTNRKLQLFFIAIGRQDQGLDSNRTLRATLKQHGIRFIEHETEGGHFYPVWREYLAHLAPLLFRPEPR
jgi:enterochelin esterase-like enzyme